MSLPYRLMVTTRLYWGGRFDLYRLIHMLQESVGQWRLLVFQQGLWGLERFAQLHRNSPEIIDFVLTHPATVRDQGPCDR